jgi:hypothetical protein
MGGRARGGRYDTKAYPQMTQMPTLPATQMNDRICAAPKAHLRHLRIALLFPVDRDYLRFDAAYSFFAIARRSVRASS